ncbi:MAG TPA: ATP-binding cassette domain-containing protein, partial [Thermoanaerobaculia bacterium]|nr:ATP-binding cassette domain-containing protein [Thermoanaerobaculia bacterium]
MIELRNISKRFGDVLANDRVSFAVAPGTIHALVGENGAGKSTAMRIAYGF